MPVALGLITVGFLLLASGLTGDSIPEFLTGKRSSTLSPSGGTSSDYSQADTPNPLAGASPLRIPSNPSKGRKYGFKGPNAELLEHLANIAVTQFDLTITSLFSGGHVTNSFHYRKRAFDASGNAKNMQAFAEYCRQYVGQLDELFYDPLGGWDKGKSIGPVGGHRDHVHVAA